MSEIPWLMFKVSPDPTMAPTSANLLSVFSTCHFRKVGLNFKCSSRYMVSQLVFFFFPILPTTFIFPQRRHLQQERLQERTRGIRLVRVRDKSSRWLGEINSTALSKTGHFLHIHPRKPNLPDRRLHIRENQVWTMQRRLVLLAQASKL